MSGNIAETFVDTALKNRRRTAIIDAKSGNSFTFGELNRRADSCARFLANEGLRPGEIVSLMVKPGIDFIAITIALFKLGTPIVLIDPGMGYRNLLRCIQRVAPHCLIGVPQACLFAAAARSAFSSVTKRFCVGPSLFGFPGTRLALRPETEQQPFPIYQPAADDLAAIIFTTGSTGPPKGSAGLSAVRPFFDRTWRLCGDSGYGSDPPGSGRPGQIYRQYSPLWC